MSQVDFFDASTITPIARDRFRSAARLRPALTILWHPDVARVGERTFVEGGTVQIGRNAPTFAARGVAAERPLADTCMSREAALTITFSDAGAVVTPGGTKAAVSLQLEPLLAAREVDAATLRAGAVITIGGRVALALHMVEDAPEAAPDLGLVGRSDAIDAVRRDIMAIAGSDSPVLVRGETGTGKELVVRALVAQGKRANAPFIARNVGALPTATAVAELFGHEKGAFTGATEARPGYFGQADGGTLFLDEIGNMAPDVQAMLLRAIETAEIVPLGSNRRARKVDVRLIAATDAALEDAIADGRFSEPLFQRLAKAEVRLPPLRERPSDVGLLLLHFLREALAQRGAADRLEDRGTAPPWLGADDVARLALHDWPGNVRELENFAGKLVLASATEKYAAVEKVDALLARRRPARRALVDARHREVDVSNDDFLKAFEANGYIPAATARALGVSRGYIYTLMDRNQLRTVEQIPDDEILGSVKACGGDRKRAAAKLRVSHYALKARLDAADPAKARAAR